MYRKPLQTTTYGIAVFNLFAAFIYSIAIVDKLHIEGKIRVPVQIAFIIVFAVLEFIPKVVLLPAGAAGFMNGFTAWSLLAGIGNPVIKMILRIVAIIVFAGIVAADVHSVLLTPFEEEFLNLPFVLRRTWYLCQAIEVLPNGLWFQIFDCHSVII